MKKFVLSKIEKVVAHEFYQQVHKRKTVLKYLLLLIIIVGYFTYVSIKYGTDQGVIITLLTWSFFVLCTPIADAGFLIDFPVRLLTGLRMFFSEMIVWIVAISINLYFFFFNNALYQDTFILKLFNHILSQPFPYWGIIILSCIGTFLSVYFGDEIFDVISHEHRKKYHAHKHKWRIVAGISLVVLIFIMYDFLLIELGMSF